MEQINLFVFLSKADHITLGVVVYIDMFLIDSRV